MLMFYVAMIEAEPDQQRFERIYNRYHMQMIRVALYVLHNMADAEDAVQNALYGIAKNIQSVPQDEKVEKAYVLTAAKYAALSIAPKKQFQDSMLDFSKVEISSTESLFDRVVNNENYELLVRAIRSLETPYREVLMLVYVQEQSIKAAAEILCRKEDTVRKQLLRGKKKLIDLCAKEGMCFD